VAGSHSIFLTIALARPPVWMFVNAFAFRTSTPIMFYSATGYEADRQRGLDAGARACVVKPNFETLERTISQLVRP
jgi:DNA-binding response OmpR family regulator